MAVTGVRPAAIAAFHTSTVRYANPLKKKSSAPGTGPGYRESKSARMNKPKRVERARPPAIGERRALRRRIVLSNPNALEVKDMQDLSAEMMRGAADFHGTVVGLPIPLLDQLRAVQAFKPKQGWSTFRRPGTIMRQETLELAQLFEATSGDGEGKGRVVKRIITGAKGAGKSVHLLQAMAMAFIKNWVVISVPSGV